VHQHYQHYQPCAPSLPALPCVPALPSASASAINYRLLPCFLLRLLSAVWVVLPTATG
jgi:hypothetical protein